MLNRKSSRAEAAEEKVKAEVTGDTKVVTVECDLQDYDNVVAGAKKAAEVAAEYGGLDALVTIDSQTAFVLVSGRDLAVSR